jgi:release factor glutamine methyltransferase
LLALETGVAHHAELIRLCSEAGFSRSESKQDLTERDRFIFAWR